MGIGAQEKNQVLGEMFEGLRNSPRPRPQTNAARSAANIADWRSYLSQECVNTMVRMGWDHSL